MKHFKGHKLAILPLLTVLSMSPATLQSIHHGRSIASVQEEVKPEVKKDEVKSAHPKYDQLVSKNTNETKPEIDLTIEKFKVKRDELAAKLKKDREEFKKDQSDKKIVEDQRKQIEKDAVEILLVESGLKELKGKNAIEKAEEDATLKLLEDSKVVVEGLLTDLESNEVLVAKASEPRKEETKKEEPKKEDKPVVVADSKPEPKKEEPKKEEPKKEEAKKEVACEAEKQNKVLTAQVEELMKQNQQILQAMLGMTNMMVSMFQQQHQQPNPFYSNGPGYQVSPYQYQQPQSAGNWVYYPSGFQPNQPNIFAQPVMQQPAQSMGSIYPNQMNQQMPMQTPQQNWNMQPQNYFGQQPQQQYQPMQMPQSQPLQIGNFGNSGVAFNMSNNVPTISQR